MTNEEKKDGTSEWVLKIGGFVMSIILMVASWFLHEAWDRIEKIETTVHALELSSATTAGNRFSSSDWQTNKALLDAERLAMDRRLIRLEESLPSIKEDLSKIRALIERNPQS